MKPSKDKPLAAKEIAVKIRNADYLDRIGINLAAQLAALDDLMGNTSQSTYVFSLLNEVLQARNIMKLLAARDGRGVRLACAYYSLIQKLEENNQKT